MPDLIGPEAVEVRYLAGLQQKIDRRRERSGAAVSGRKRFSGNRFPGPIDLAKISPFGVFDELEGLNPISGVFHDHIRTKKFLEFGNMVRIKEF